jgi:hypothetical protein
MAGVLAGLDLIVSLYFGHEVVPVMLVDAGTWGRLAPLVG